jgi:tetratricopeptide (TPR) repeat protein
VKTGSTILLWVVLIVIFVLFIIFYSLFTQGSLPETGVWLIFLVGGAVGLPFGLRTWRRLHRGKELKTEGARLLGRGHIAAALEKFEESCTLLKDEQAPLSLDMSLCHLKLWQLEAAERALLRARRTKGLAEEFKPLIPPRRALVAALRGQAEQAQEWLAEARELGRETEAMAIIAEAVLACRRGAWAEARRLLEQPETHALGGPIRGLRDTLLAWSVERLTGERRHVDPVTVFGEASTDRLQAAWPELVAFLLAEQRSPPLAAGRGTVS